MKSKGSTAEGMGSETGNALPTSDTIAFTPEFRRRISQVIDAAGSLVKAGEIAGVSDEQVGRWRDGLSKPNFFGIGSLAVATGFSLDWLLTGAGLPHTEARRQIEDMDRMRAQLANPGRKQPTSDEADPSIFRAVAGDELPDEFRLIPRLDVQPSSGFGALIQDEAPLEMLAFRADWLRRVGINPDFAHVLTNRGDSNEPTIRDGDILLVDTSIDKVIDNAFYVVVYSGRALLKRVQIMRDGDIILSSDNKLAYQDERIPASDVPELTIAARLMWFGRSI